MITKALAVLIVWLASMVCAHADSSPAMQEGLWEITTELEMEGMPMKMPPTTFTQCLKKGQAVPMDQKPGQQCKIKDVTTEGSTTRWSVECSGSGGQMTGKGTASYSGDNMEGSMHMQTQGMTMTSHYKGRRLGACQ